MADQELKAKLSELREIDFTALDYSTIQTELIEYIRTAQSNAGVLDEFLDGDAAKIMIDLFSYLGDLLAFRIDTQANETYLSTAQRRQSLINILEQVGQTVQNQTTASVQLSAVPQVVSTTDIEIPARFSFETTGLDGNDVTFEIMNDATDYFNPVIIPAGVNNFNVRAFSGEYRSFNTISTGEPSFTFTLPDFPVVDDSILASVTPVGESFLTDEIIESSRVEQVELLVNPSTEIIYRIKYDEDGKATLIFATEDFGKIPPNGYTVHVDYRVNAGANTNVATNSILTDLTLTNLGGESITLTLSNPDGAATGGEEAEELDTIRLKTPGLVRSNDNLVTIQDYEAVVADIAGVQDVFAVDRYTDQNVYQSKFAVPKNSVFMWILPSTGGEISPDLRQVISQELEARRLAAIENFVFNPIYNDWSLTANVKLLSTANTAETRATIEQALLDTFGKEVSQFKNQLFLSQIISLIQSQQGVDYVELTSPTQNLQAEENEVLRLVASNIGLNITK
jgi:hypothetical protein